MFFFDFNSSQPSVAGVNSSVPISDFPITDGPVLTTAISPDGHILYLGGAFSQITESDDDTFSRNNLAAIDLATLTVTDWNPNADDEVYAIAISGDSIFVGGAFSSIGSTDRSEFAKLNRATGQVDPDCNPNFWTHTGEGTASVHAITTSDSYLYVGGSFDKVGGEDGIVRNELARLHNNSTCDLDSWDPNIFSNSAPTVYTIALSGDAVFIGGAFSGLGVGDSFVERSEFAKISATTGLVDDACNPNFWSDDEEGSGGSGGEIMTVHSIKISGSYIYVGGSFDKLGGEEGTPRNELARLLNNSTCDLDSWNPNISLESGLSPSIYDIEIVNDQVYLAGDFDTVTSQGRGFSAILNSFSGNTSRNSHSSSVYQGKIYFWGGGNADGYLNTLDIYDIAQNTWTTGASGGTARRFHSSETYQGKIYFWGGDSGGDCFNTLDIYDIAQNTWTTGASGGTARRLHSSSIYQDKIYFWGGYNDSDDGYLNTLDIYDIAQNTWTTGASGGTARYSLSSEPYQGKIYFWGGSIDGHGQTNTLDIYDITQNTWTTGASGGTARFHHSSSLYQGKIYFWGGSGYNDSDDGYLNTLDIYDIAQNTWTTGASGGTGRIYYSSSLYQDKIYFWGGNNDDGILNTIDIYDITSNSWTGFVDSWNPNLNGPSYTLAISDPYLIIGGDFSSVGDVPKSYLAAFPYDTTPPVVSSILPVVSAVGGTITWTTDEAASSQLEYGLNTNLGTTTPVTDTSPLVTSHSVSLSSLLSCTIYYYRTVSVDSGSNVSYSDTDLFVTSGCAGSTANASVSAYGLSSLTNSTGTGLTLASTVSGLALTLPPSVSSSLDAGTTFDLQAKVLDSASVMSVISSPTLPASAPSNTGNQLISNIFDLKLYTGVTTTLSSFDQPVTLTLSYTPSQIDNVNPSTLSIYRHDGTTWHALTSTHDSTTRTLSATTTAFSLFAIFGQTYQPSSSSSSSPSSSNPGPPLCTDQLPSSIPDLFEIQTTSTTARLKFTPISNTSTYYISFSTSPQAEQHGELVTLLREGEQTHTVYQLRPNTTYYFKVRGQNGCMPGPWSDTIKAKTNFSTTRLSFFYKWLSRFGKLILNPATTNF